MLFLAMQVRVMAACMESQIDKQEYTASAQSRARDGTGGINQPSDVCGLTSIEVWMMYKQEVTSEIGAWHRLFQMIRQRKISHTVCS